MTTICPYLTFNGNCEDAFLFYKSIFGGEFGYIGRFGEMPNPSQPIPDELKNKIMHVSLPISKETVLMGSDSSDAFGHATIIGNNITISINTDSEEEVDRLYKALSMDGTIKYPLEKTFWGAYFGQLTDKFGIQWMVNCELQEHKDYEEKHRKDQ